LRDAIFPPAASFAARNNIGKCFANLEIPTGRSGEAKAGAELAKQKTSEQAPVLPKSGRRLLQARLTVEGAFRKFRAEIKLRPYLAAAHFQLGMAFRSKGKIERGERIKTGVTWIPATRQPVSGKKIGSFVFSRWFEKADPSLARADSYFCGNSALRGPCGERHVPNITGTPGDFPL